MELHDTLRNQLAALDIGLEENVLMTELDFLSELMRWNKTYNLTSITDPFEGVEKHLVDSLVLLPYLAGVSSMLDIGSGGGFPGLPLQIARPDLRTVSVDAVAKKISFQRHIVRRLKLIGFSPWHGRIEEGVQQAFAVDGFDLIVARAFASLRNYLELALPYLKPGGRIVAMKGPEGERELIEVCDWLGERGLCCIEQKFITLPQSRACRCLLFFTLNHKM